MLKSILYYVDLLAALQTEKAYALRYDLTRAPADAQDCREQSAQADTLLEQLEVHAGQDLLPQLFREHAQERLERALTKEATADALSNWYACHLERPTLQALVNKMLGFPELPPTQASAIAHLIAATDLLAQIRDSGLCIYARGEIKTPDIQHMKAITHAFLVRERLFLGMADDGLKQKVGEIKAALSDSGSRMEDILRKLNGGYAKGLLADTPMPVWFEVFAEHLGVFYKIIQQTIERTVEENKDALRPAENASSLEGDIEWQLAALSVLPLFRGLSEKTLRTVLRGARLIDVEKNKTFITQGEPLNRFYIVVEGWVKTLKATDEGEESILQIAGKRDAIVDNGPLTSTVAAFSAKAVTKARLLALPIAQLREHVARNEDLAQNLLAVTTARLQKLVSQYEQITLRTATQRVGWFLVTLYLETGLEGAPLALPFEKSLIAAYLNIKPETFSRALQQFRKDGFKIDKDRVVLPHPQALCSYCDPDMSLRCCRAEAVNCAPIRIAKRAETR